jgi:hypothetical protein
MQERKQSCKFCGKLCEPNEYGYCGWKCMRDHLGADAKPYRDDVLMRSRERAERAREALLKAEREASRKAMLQEAVWAGAIGTAVSIAGLGLALLSLPRIRAQDPIFGSVSCCGGCFVAPLIIAAGFWINCYSISRFLEYLYEHGSRDRT